MNVTNRFLNLMNVFLISIFFIISSCSTKPAIVDFPPTANPLEEISKLETRMENALENHVDILSPSNFNDAKEALMNAKIYYSKGRGSKLTLHEVASGNAYLSRANMTSKVVLDSTGEILPARQNAIDAEAHLYFGKEFNEVDNELKRITKNIEKNNLNDLSSIRPRLQAKYLELELFAIREKNLKDSRNTIALAKKEGARKFAPRTLTIAEKKYNDTFDFITANRHDKDEIEKRAMLTKEAANHALKINRIAQSSDKISSEDIALTIEKEKNKVAMKENQLVSVEDKLETTQSALEKEKMNQNENLEKTKKELIAIKLRDEKYEEARKTFSSNEAEVYKQGDDLLIRLKGMEFPSAKASIPSKNFNLLSKVQKIIENFGEGTAVTIEGHTDSLGKKKTNEQLSTQRAIAVKDYLESNSNGIVEKIEAIGLGDEKPIAGNKTASGRAQNRRVDIIIKPETTKL